MRFIAMWQGDNYKDYLYPAPPPAPEGRDVLSKLMSGEKIVADLPPKPPVRESRKVGMSKKANPLVTGNGFLMELDVDDDSDLSDLGFQPDKLKELLIKRPDLAAMLQKNLMEAGLADS